MLQRTFVCLVLVSAGSSAFAQVGSVDREDGLRVEAVRIEIANPSTDPGINREVEDQVRRIISLFPQERFSRERVEFALSQTKRNRNVESAEYTTDFGTQGGIVVVIRVRLRPSAERLSPPAVQFPTLYDADGTFARAKLDMFSLYYANNNAWYGRPDLLLAGNPLAAGGTPAGEGYADWLETYVHGGLYGITPVSPRFYVYGGVSAMLTMSAGEELFTDESRTYVGIEDAYAGFIVGDTSATGRRLVFNFSAGRQRFTLGDGLLIINTAFNGDERAALQANARWASDLLVLGQVRYNDTKVELFRVDPDELPLLDSKTKVDGLNVESELAPGLTIGGSYLTVPSSEAGFFLPDGTRLGREGLDVLDLRGRWQPRATGQSGAFFAAEIARQTHDRFSMKADAYATEFGYSFAESRWMPTVSYRYGEFSGDDATTARFERWDPLFSGGTGEQWVQGANHFKVVQDSNVQAHRLQVRLRPHAKVELVPQLWFFRAESVTNLGGNPALSVLQSRDYGREINLTGKVFWSRRIYVHGHVAFTEPGDAVDIATGDTAKSWWSTMIFIRYGF